MLSYHGPDFSVDTTLDTFGDPELFPRLLRNIELEYHIERLLCAGHLQQWPLLNHPAHEGKDEVWIAISMSRGLPCACL